MSKLVLFGLLLGRLAVADNDRGLLLQPVQSETHIGVNEDFGPRETWVPILDVKLPTFHEGIDFRVAPGTPVLAADTGRVVFAGRSKSSGNAIIIDHGNGFSTRYYNLRSVSVRPGQVVSQGASIGEAGVSDPVLGGFRLHFKLRKGSPKLFHEMPRGMAIDPLPLFGKNYLRARPATVPNGLRIGSGSVLTFPSDEKHHSQDSGKTKSSSEQIDRTSIQHADAGDFPIESTLTPSAAPVSESPAGHDTLVKVSRGRCGAAVGSDCVEGLCCSRWGFCGKGPEFCETSSSGPGLVRADGRCGPKADGASCKQGQCCSKLGYCGTGSSYCSNSLKSHTSEFVKRNPEKVVRTSRDSEDPAIMIWIGSVVAGSVFGAFVAFFGVILHRRRSSLISLPIGNDVTSKLFVRSRASMSQ